MGFIVLSSQISRARDPLLTSNQDDLQNSSNSSFHVGKRTLDKNLLELCQNSGELGSNLLPIIGDPKTKTTRTESTAWSPTKRRTPSGVTATWKCPSHFCLDFQRGRPKKPPQFEWHNLACMPGLVKLSTNGAIQMPGRSSSPTIRVMLQAF